MRERKRRHDDVHFPMGGRGKRSTKPKSAYAPPAAQLIPWNPGSDSKREEEMTDARINEVIGQAVASHWTLEAREQIAAQVEQALRAEGFEIVPAESAKARLKKARGFLARFDEASQDSIAIQALNDLRLSLQEPARKK